MIYSEIRAALLTFKTVTDLVGKNTTFSDLASQYAIRPGRLRESDPHPGLVMSLPTIELDGPLSGRGGFAKAQLEVAAITQDLDGAWDLIKAVCWDGGDPDDSTQVLSGLDGYRNLSGNGLQAIKLTNFLEDQLETNDKSDRLLWIVQVNFSVEFDVASIVTGD
jgi:hypothetical protein